jgi:hypothetical protein
MRVLRAPAPCAPRCGAPRRAATAPRHAARQPPPPARRCALLRAAPQRGGSEPAADEVEEEPDLVSRFVAAIFGKKVLEDPNPAGLKRMTKEDWPDQWPAVVDSYAAPVEGDTPEMALLRPLLRQTQARARAWPCTGCAVACAHGADASCVRCACRQLEYQPLALAFDADVHGWNNAAFHKQLDGQGATVLIMRTKGGAVCGGCAPAACGARSRRERDPLRLH